MMETIVFDVMLNEQYIHTFRYKHCPAFKLRDSDLKRFVISKLPTLKNKDFTIEFVK